MKILGLIVEYNPFHNGHLHHLKTAQELTQADITIAIMSGHFTQRGDLAIVSKWNRTETALEHGVDIVLEYPFPLQVQSASHFAQVGVDILKSFHITDLVFGSESNDLRTLQIMADSPINVDALKEQLRQGQGYPRASQFSGQHFPPNDILSIAYLKALKGSSIEAHIIPRTNAYHGTAIEDGIASATAIRHAFQNNEPTEHTSPMKLKDLDIFNQDLLYPLYSLLLNTLSKEELASLFMMDEGMENLFTKKIALSSNRNDFIERCIGKRYTRARIQRALVHLLCHVQKEDIVKLRKFHTPRILGLSAKGRQYLRDNPEIKAASRYNQLSEIQRILNMKACVAASLTLPEEKRKAFIKREIQGPIVV